MSDRVGANPRFEKGNEYNLDELPENEATPNGGLEQVDVNLWGGKFDGEYVTFEVSKMRVVDVREADSR